jgi:translation initiation factor IF-1
MSKEDFLEFEGVITELLPEGRFRVRLDNDHMVLAYTAGRMKRNKIRSLVGDRVTVEMTPYDLDKGRITFRHKTEGGPPRPGGAARPQFRGKR